MIHSVALHIESFKWMLYRILVGLPYLSRPPWARDRCYDHIRNKSNFHEMQGSTYVIRRRMHHGVHVFIVEPASLIQLISVCICVVATSLSPDFTRRGGWCKLLFAINLTDVCLGTAFMLSSATVQRQWLTTIVPQFIDISFGGHRGVYIEG